MSPSRAPGLHAHDAAPHRLVGQLAQPPRLDRTFADDEHAAGVAMPAVLDDGDVDVDDVAVLQRPLVRDAVADLMVDRGADRLGVGHVARRRIVQRRRHRALHVHDVVVRQAVEFLGGHAGLDMRRQHVQHLRGQPSCHAHALDVAAGLQCDRHGSGLSHPANKMPGMRVDGPSPAPPCHSPAHRPRDRMPAHPQHLMHFEGGNALSAFRARTLLQALQRGERAHRRRVGPACALGALQRSRWTPPASTSWRPCCATATRRLSRRPARWWW